MSKNYCLISHTHWDREWYMPLENMRMRLVDLIDHLLEILDTDPGYRFHLDAQTIVLEDYLAIRPHRKEVLQNYIAEGRILVGPWYVQNDFHLTDGESTVRNLMIGQKIANDYGKCMMIGYAADQFGLCSQLPQILRKSGLRDCIFGRGFDRGVTEFFWETEDGSKILCEHMKFWYNNAQRLSPIPEGALKLVRERGEWCSKFCATDNYLLMNGVDHLEAQEDLTEIIEKIRPMMDEDEKVFQDTLPEFIQRVREYVAENGIELKTFRGEFRDNGADNVLTGTLSSRAYIKQANAAAQVELERNVEPIYTLLAAAHIKDYPHDWMRYLWKLLIENHPHDSICGCSVDVVHNHMMDRYARIHENTVDLTKRAFYDMNAHIPGDDGDYRVFLFNFTGTDSDKTVRVTIDIHTSVDKGGFTLVDENGNIVPFVLENIERDVGSMLISPVNLPGDARNNRYTVTIDAGLIKAFSYRILTVKLNETPVDTPATLELRDNIMENDRVMVEIYPDGAVKITDKQSGKVIDRALVLEDTPDRGESYNYSHGDPAGDITTAGVNAVITTVDNTPHRQSRRVNYSFAVDREESCGSVDIEMLLTIEKNSSALDVQMTINNQLDNHRLRVLVPTDVEADTNFASQPYDIVIRDKVSKFRNDREHPSTDFVGVEANGLGVAVFHHGLYEYEHMTDEHNTLAVTLLRSTGRITGRWDERNTMARDWMAPGCQCRGINHAHFAVMAYSGDHVSAKIAAKAQLFMCPVYATALAVDSKKSVGGRPFVQSAGMPDLFYRHIENADVKLPYAGTIVRIEEADEAKSGAMVITAVKQAENGGEIVVRAYNSTSDEVKFTLSSPMFGIRSAKVVSLMENEIYETLGVADDKAEYTAKPKEIVTIIIK